MTSLHPTHTPIDPAKPLRTALLANAGFSSLSGLVFVLWSVNVAGLIGLGSGWPVVFAGLGLFLYAAGLVIIARKPQISPIETIGIIVADLSWVVVSALAIVFFGELIPAIGEWLIAGIALIVLDFALWQAWSLKRLKA